MSMQATSMPLRIDPSNVTISGISSGADFAVQFHVAFSATIKGVGIFAGQPYHCAVTRFEDDPLVPPDPRNPVPCDSCPPHKTLQYDHCKHHSERIQQTRLQNYTRQAAARGLIDDPRNLSNHRIYLYRGTKDTCYEAGSEGEVVEFYHAFNSGHDGQFALEATIPSLHAQPTIHKGSPCGGPYDGPYSYLANCGYDGAGAALQHLYRGPRSCQWPDECHGRHPAPFSRIKAQLENEAPILSGPDPQVIAWEWTSCLSPTAGNGAAFPEANKANYEAYLAHIKELRNVYW